MKEVLREIFQTLLVFLVVLPLMGTMWGLIELGGISSPFAALLLALGIWLAILSIIPAALIGDS